METSQPVPRRPRSYFALLIAFLSFGAIGLMTDHLLSDAQRYFHASPDGQRIPYGGAEVLAYPREFMAYCGGAVLLVFSLAELVASKLVWGRFARWFGWALHVVATLLFLAALYLSFVAHLGMLWGNVALERKLADQRQELDVYALTLLTLREKRCHNLLMLSPLTDRIREVPTEADMKPEEQARLLATMARLLDDDTASPGHRRVLATLPLLSDARRREPRFDELFLHKARQFAGLEFPDLETFFRYLPIIPKDEGWEPLPLQVVE